MESVKLRLWFLQNEEEGEDGSGAAYRERVVDGELAERLSAIGAVLIEGPKACGKTESATQKAATTYRLDVDPAARNAASVAPELLLDSPSPVLFDEWQVVPTLWDQVRRAVDDRAPCEGAVHPDRVGDPQRGRQPALGRWPYRDHPDAAHVTDGVGSLHRAGVTAGSS